MTDTVSDDVAAVGRIDVVPKILDVVCRTTGMGFAAVARVTPERWVACAVRDQIDFGLKPGGELMVATTICDEIRSSGRRVVIDHVAEDAVFSGHPTPKMYGFESYISVPIQHRGEFFGTLCAIDPSPHNVSAPETVAMFELFAELIGSHLDTEARLAESEAALLDARQAAELRDQFIAVLGHDLRNPLASIDGGARLLLRTPLDEKATALVGLVQGSVKRMAGLIDNVVDFARGRLGGGFALERRLEPSLGVVLEHVVAELRTANPHWIIETDLRLTDPVFCDSRRIAQLASNLLSNALTHGVEGEAVRVKGDTRGGVFELSVSNTGEAIPETALPLLFLPFSRAALRPGQQGLGLGLYIASEIARAHEGALDVVSDEAETRFTLRMPVVPAENTAG